MEKISKYSIFPELISIILVIFLFSVRLPKENKGTST